MADGMEWNGHTWLYVIDGKTLTEDQTYWYRRGCEAEAESRTAVRKKSPKKVSEFMDFLEAVEEHWEPKTVGYILITATRVFQSALTHEDKADIKLALRGHSQPWYHRLIQRCIG